MNVGIGTYDLKDQAINIVDLQKGQIWPTKTDENDSKFIQNSPEIVKLPEGYQFPQKGFGGIIT